MRLLLICSLLSLAVWAQTAPSPSDGNSAKKQNSSAPSLPHFEDIANQSGLTVSHISSPAAKYIIESVSGGVGFIDCDNDGKLDILTVNGSTVERYKQGGDLMVTLYHQDDSGGSAGADPKFTDITKAAGLTRKGW